MGLDFEGGETSCEDLSSGKLRTLRQKDLDIDGGSEVEIQKAVQRTCSSDDIPLGEILDDSYGYVPPKTHICLYCDKAFNRPNRLASHMLTHTNERPFKCEVPGCEKAYVSAAHLYRHTKDKHSSTATYREVLKCPHPCCSKELGNQQNLKRHYKDVHERKYPFSCQFCDKGFFRHHQFQTHQYEHTGVPPFKCPTCGMGFISQSRLQRHQKRHNYTCECGQNFEDYLLLRKHTMLSHSVDFVCDVCKKTFKNKAMLREHISVHQNKFDREVLWCPYDFCPRIYFHKRNLTQHIKSSHEGKKYECTYPDCGTKLCTRQKLKEHVEFHHGKQRWPRKSVSLHRKIRRDAGKVRRSMATLLSGVILPHKEEKALLNNKSCDIKITENGNSGLITNCTELENAPDHLSWPYKRKEKIILKNIKFQFASQDAVQNNNDDDDDDDNDDIHIGEPWQHPEVPVNGSHACESGNFVQSGKDCVEQGSEFAEVVESRMDIHQEVGDAHVAGKATRDEMREDIENLPASTFSVEECQHRKGGMQTHGENALSLQTNPPQEYEHQRKWLVENKNMLHESLKIQSQQSTGEKNKVWMNVRIVALSLNDALSNGQASLQNSENFIPSVKDCGVQDSGLAQVVESSVDGHQEETQEQLCPLNLTMDVRERLYLMQRVMEEIFPTIKTVC